VTVDIVGTGTTTNFYEWPDGREKWSVGSAFTSFGARIDLYFCFHNEPVDVFNKSDISYLDKHNYPLDKIIKKLGSRYFTNSIGYMIAFAIYRGYKNINIWGVDMESDSEYSFERPCVTYWIGQAEARGINVTIASGLTDPFVLYGYEDASPLLAQYEMRRKHAKMMSEKTEGAERDQWLGKMIGMRDAINIMRS
jgi:hypothetical protein